MFWDVQNAKKRIRNKMYIVNQREYRFKKKLYLVLNRKILIMRKTSTFREVLKIE